MAERPSPFSLYLLRPKLVEMISVKRIYEVLKDLANKEQRGFVSPTEFNTMAPIAQMAVYNKMWDEVLLAENISRRNLDGQRGMSKVDDVRNELAMYLSLSERSASTGTSVARGASLFSYPSDYYRFDSLETTGVEVGGETTSKAIDILYDPFKLNYIRRSPLSKPTVDRPIAVITTSIEVYPSAVKRARLRYWRIPQGRLPSDGTVSVSQPQYNFTVVGGDEVFDSATSINFDLPQDREAELVVEMAGMIGTALRDAALINYGRQQK